MILGINMSMSPKFIQLTRKSTGETLFVNPRRIDFFREERRPTQQPDLVVGTEVSFGRSEGFVVKESVSDIKRLLSK